MAWNIFQKKEKKEEETLKKPSAGAPATLPVKPVQDKPIKEKRTPPSARRTFGTFPVASQKIIIRPLATEKARSVNSRGVYAFQVKKNATKIEIAKAFSNLYGVMPLGVRTMNYGGKVVRFGRREGKRANWKKALVTVPEGVQIDIT